MFSVWIGVGVASMFSCLGSNNDENDTNHLKVERMLLSVCFGVCVDGFKMDVLVRVHGCVSLHFPPFYFSCFFVLFFSRFVLVIFSHFFHDLNVHVFFFFFAIFSHFLSFFIFVFFTLVIFLNFRHFHFCHFHVS